MKFYFTTILVFLTTFGQAQIQTSSGLPSIDSIGMEIASGAILLDSAMWKKIGLDSIELFNPSFEYSIIHLSQKEVCQCVIIQRAYLEENIHWSCTLTKDGQLIDWITSAYDNSEGFLSIKTFFKSNIISVEEWNLYKFPQDSIRYYLITETGEFQGVK